MTERIYLVKENFWNGGLGDNSDSWEKIQHAFDTPAKAKAWVRHEKKMVKLDARKNGDEIRITADRKGTHVFITTDEYGCDDSYIDWTVTEITVR